MGQNKEQIMYSESTIELKLQRSLRLYGILFIILGIITFIFTYKYIFPLGSIFLIISGLYIIFLRKWRKMFIDKVDKLILKERK